MGKSAAAQVRWKIYQAETCLGTAMLPLLAPDAPDPTCGIAALGDGDLREDFDRASQRHGWRRVQHWGKWYADCTATTGVSGTPIALQPLGQVANECRVDGTHSAGIRGAQKVPA